MSVLYTPISAATQCYWERTDDRQRFLCHKAQCKTCVDLDYNLYPELFTNRPDRRCISTYLYSIQKSARFGCHKCVLLFDGIKQLSALPGSS